MDISLCITAEFQTNSRVNKHSLAVVNALIIHVSADLCEADGWSRSRIRGEASTGDGGVGKLVKQMMGGC